MPPLAAGGRPAQFPELAHYGRIANPSYETRETAFFFVGHVGSASDSVMEGGSWCNARPNEPAPEPFCNRSLTDERAQSIVPGW
jgi:hypothetical protein